MFLSFGVAALTISAKTIARINSIVAGGPDSYTTTYITFGIIILTIASGMLFKIIFTAVIL